MTDWVQRLMVGRKYAPDQPREPEGTPSGGRWTSGMGGGLSEGPQLADDLAGAGIENLKSGRCWIFASAMWQRLKDAGEEPKIVDWSGHVEAATKRPGGTWTVHTPDGPINAEDHRMSRLKPIWKIHDSPDALLRFLDKDYPGLSPSRRQALWDDFRKAQKIVGGKWKVPKE